MEVSESVTAVPAEGPARQTQDTVAGIVITALDSTEAGFTVAAATAVIEIGERGQARRPRVTVVSRSGP